MKILFLVSIFNCFLQAGKPLDYWEKKFDSEFLNSKSKFLNYSKCIDKSLSGNSYDFLYICEGIDALNMMYESTNNIKYLDLNAKIVENIMAKSFSSNYFPKRRSGLQISEKKMANSSTNYQAWKADTKGVARLSRIDGVEWMLNEGYLFRYITKFLYDIKASNLHIQNSKYKTLYNKLLPFIEKNVWEKWYTRSLQEWGDDSYFYASRTHMASHWATIAILLSKMSEDKSKRDSYISFYNSYDRLLRKNLHIVNKNNKECYVWNSTWDNIPGNAIKNQKPRDKPAIQDVAHGNHVLQYVTTAYGLKNQNWTAKDIQRFSNTASEIILANQKKGFSDTFPENVNGTMSEKNSTTGRYQTDGWMKLARYNKNLVNVYEKYFETRELKFKRPNVLFFANMCVLTK
jgi:hypothetical protein